MAETPAIKSYKEPTDKEIEDYLGIQRGLGATNQPTKRQMMGVRPAPAPPKDEWERLGRLAKDDPDAFKKEAPRIPMHHDFLLTVAADDLDKFNTLGQLYGENNVRGLQDGSFIVKKLDKKTGKEEYLRTDEKGLTWRDASDVVGGVISATPEMAGWVAATSFHASKAPQHPYTKGGLLALTASGMAGSELLGGAKDYLYRKFKLKQDPRTKEILGRRSINFAVGLPLGWGLGRLAGGGKFSKEEVKQFQKMLDEDPALFVSEYWNHPDDLISSQAKLAAKEFGIEMPGAAHSLGKKGGVTATRHASRISRKIPLVDDPMRKYELSQQRGLATAKRELTKGPVDYQAMGSGVRAATVKGEQQLRHWSQGEATKAVAEAEQTALSQIPPWAQIQKFDAKSAGDKLRTSVQKHAKRRKDEVEALYADVEVRLATEGVVEFVEFKKLADAIRAWRTELPTVTEKITIPSTIIGGKPTVQKVKTPIGQYDEATTKANEWVQMAENPLTLRQAQKLIIDLGEMTRAGTMGKEEGVTGLKGMALNKFYGAAKDDLNHAFDSLKISDDLKELWGNANLEHAMKVDELNKSRFVQSALRPGRAGGKEVESAQLLTHLIGGTSPATRKAELKLVQGMLKPAEYEELRQSLVKEMVGLNHPIKITTALEEPLVLSSGKTVARGEELKLANLSQLIEQFEKPGNLGFLQEVFNDPLGKKVDALKTALDDFKEMQQIHGVVGRNAGIEAAKLEDMMVELRKGDPSKARQIMQNAIAAEKDRKKIYYDLLDAAYQKNNFQLIADSPEQFVDDVILAGGNKSAEFGSTFFRELPDEVKDEVRRATADRIIVRTSDIVRTPIKYLKEGPEKMLMFEPKEGAFLKLLYEDPARQRLFKEMFTEREIEVLDKFGAMMQVAARMKAIGGSAGAMAAETAIGTGSLKSIGGQLFGSKVLMSDPVQELMAKGELGKGLGLWAWFVRLANSKWLPENTPQGRAEAAKQTAINLEMGINPTKIKMAMALDPPTADELGAFVHEYFYQGLQYAGRDKEKKAEYESTFGVGLDNLSTEEEIKEFLDQELNKKQGK